MEEISSLDSFHTDGADSVVRPESEPPKLDEEASQTSNDKNPADAVVSAVQEDEPRPDTEIDAGGNDEEEGADNEEEFEQISDGSFEVDENSQATSADPPPYEGTILDKPSEGGLESNDAGEDVGEAKKSSNSKETDFEEVDAHISANAITVAEESDMLGESDMTLPTQDAGKGSNEGDEDGDGDEGTGTGDKSISGAMNVDEEGEMEGEAEGELQDGVQDVEMPSASNSPSTAKNRGKSNEYDSMEIADENEAENAMGKDEADTKKEEKKEAEGDDDGCGDKEKITEGRDKETGDAEEEEAEQDDEPVENVQEPEESDVCLIPDDTETQMTEAEKEQAILARENAEKADAEEQAEKEKEKEKEKENESTGAANVNADASATADETDNVVEEGTENDGKANAEARANQAGAEAAEAACSEENTTAIDANDAADADEPLLEEMQRSSEPGAVQKIIIAWIVSILKKCKQCGVEKDCGFRFKNPDSNEFEYICEQACCDELLAANAGKYFIRRKKFLVEELLVESSAAVSESENFSIAEANQTPAEGGEISESARANKSADSSAEALDGEQRVTSAAKGASHCCLQCKEAKICKYFFKQDDECFYVCNDDCFNLLNAEEPDKFKLKRHSIRVRNIGATISSSTTSAAKKVSGPESRVVARTAAEAEAARLERVASFTRRCAECFNEITLGDKNLLWETMDFCNEICLGKYQRTIGANCQTCNGEVSHQALGKYCVRFGFDIRQFCCASCLNEFKKGLKTCSCCQKDISAGSEGFLAPVGDKEQFKDFCSQACMRHYDIMCNPKKKLRNDVCAVCNHEKPVRVEIMLDGKEHTFCSNPCFSAFKFVSNIVADQCNMCCKYFERKGADSFTIYTERRAKVFCSRICLNVFIIVNRRIVSCQWCKVKKYNFDMIYKQQDAQEILMCSLNCLTLYGVSINAFSRTVAKCDNCNQSATPQYHLTMSDASMRNFCTYQCVMQFQSQFARAPLTLENESQTQPTAQQQQQAANSSKSSAPFPTGLPKRVKLKVNQQQSMMKLSNKSAAPNKKGPTMPVISTVSSLASGETETMIGSVTVRRSRGRGRKIESPPPHPPAPVINTAPSGRGRPRKTVDYARSPSPVSRSPPRSSSKRGAASHAAAALDKAVASQVSETKIITVPPYPPAVRNVQTSCKPQTVTVGFQTQPSTTSTGTQTGKDYSNKVLIPVPVPIYVPQPMYMYSAPFPIPVPIPLPIPVPIFIPTTRNSAQGILKEIKKIQDKMPADPFEAELLMMAEMVAEEKRESDSDSDDEVKPDPSVVALQYTNSVQPVEVPNNSYGEDVLQMALKMASGDYDTPTVDLESAMTANTITNPPPGMVEHDDSMSHMSAHHMSQPQQQQQPQPPSLHMMEAQRGGRGRKRGAIAAPVSPRNSRSPVKRQRLQELDNTPQTQSQPMQPLEKPDANMCLKYTFGVNAWKQWVMTKNADIEKSSIRRRTFKTELLQMTADELNFSLCLFVKEVRKPNGTEYAPDTIYYLVLGIQQYLYENGRIDNIFTDPYYERFTDCLDEVARKFSVLYNDSQYIVTRVEEEHLWECKQLGAHSPHVLLSTLMFFNTKHFNLTTVEEHMQLSFSHIMKHWKRSAQNAKTPGTRNVLLRFYPPQAGLDANPRKKKVYEQQENEENPLRCPVRLYEFYLSKCPESVKTRNDVFYLQPERSCVPDSPVWYSTQALSQEALQKMLHRVKMVKEINIALLTS